MKLTTFRKKDEIVELARLTNDINAWYDEREKFSVQTKTIFKVHSVQFISSKDNLTAFITWEYSRKQSS